MSTIVTPVISDISSLVTKSSARKVLISAFFSEEAPSEMVLSADVLPVDVLPADVSPADDSPAEDYLEEVCF